MAGAGLLPAWAAVSLVSLMDIHPSLAAPVYNPHLSQNTPNLGHRSPGRRSHRSHGDPEGGRVCQTTLGLFGMSSCDQQPERDHDAHPCLSLPIPDPMPSRERSALAQIGAQGEPAPRGGARLPNLTARHSPAWHRLPPPVLDTALGTRWEGDFRAGLRSQNPFFPLSIHPDLFSSTETPSVTAVLCRAVPCHAGWVPRLGGWLEASPKIDEFEQSLCALTPTLCRVGARLTRSPGFPRSRRILRVSKDPRETGFIPQPYPESESR